MSNEHEINVQPPAAPAVGSSALLGGISRHSGNESGGDQGGAMYPYRKTSLGGGADVSTSLLSLLGVLTCPKVGEAEIQRLARTSIHRREIEALVNLWQSLGRPTSVFWRECRVFCNRILDSYDNGAMMPNDKSSPTGRE